MTDERPPHGIDDIADFYAKWPQLRPRMEALARSPRRTAEDRIVLDWMMRVVDRVGPVDLHPDD
ncbi:MAG: hypothetical protein AAF390_14400 [Pseudomonadota bacterium]